MAGSRRRGWGAIRSRKVKGGVSYYASYRDPVDGSERVTAPHAFSSREDAEGWLAAERRLVESGSWIHPRERLERARREREAVEARAVSFGEFAERWLVRKVRDDKVKPRTRATYRHLLDRHLLPVFGGTPVRDITPDMVASWYESLAGTPGARAGAYGLLKRVLASACEPPDPLLEFNPCHIRGGATLRSAERPVVGPGAVAAIAGRMPAEYRLAVSLAFWLSLRLGEVLALRRRDIDLERRVAHVTHALSYTKEDGFVDSTPKTEAGVRDIPIPGPLMGDIRAHLDEHAIPGADGLLFHSARGGFLYQGEFEKMYAKARDAAGFPGVRFHDLRHSGNTWFAQHTDATVADLQRRGGWSTPAMALHYLHSDGERLRRLTEQMSPTVAGGGDELEALRRENRELRELLGDIARRLSDG